MLPRRCFRTFWVMAASLCLCLILQRAAAENLFRNSKQLIANLVPNDFDVKRKGNEAIVKLKSKDLTFVNFHSSSCSHCINHAPVWVEFAKSMKVSGATVAALDCDEYRDMCSAVNVVGTPSIKVFRDGSLVRENIGEALHQLFTVAQKEFGLVLTITGAKATEAERKMLKAVHVAESTPKAVERTSSNTTNEVSFPAASEQRQTGSTRNQNVDVKSTKEQKVMTEKPSTKLLRTEKRTGFDISPTAKILHDASLAIRYGLEKGVFLGKFALSKDEERELINWLDLLRKALPSSAGRWQLDWLYQRVVALCRSGPLNSKAFDELLLGWSFARRFDEVYEWKYCTANSKTEGAGAGYTCGLWLLFHILSVNVARSPNLKDLDISSAIHGFVKNFFSCNECRENFLMHNPTPYKREVSGDTFAFAMWLWREHNYVSNRLNREDREAGIKRAPRELFPPLEMCSTCRKINHEDGTWEFDQSVVVRYLDHAFSNFPETEEVAFTNGGINDFEVDNGGPVLTLGRSVASLFSKLSSTIRLILAGSLLVVCALWIRKRRKRLIRLMKRTKH